MPHQRDFTRTGHTLSPEQSEPYLQVFREHFPHKKVVSVIDRGTWLRKIIRIDLEGGDIYYLQFPPFATCPPPLWRAFVDGYGPLPARKRILLYTVLQTLCAMMGSYWELAAERPAGWESVACTRLKNALDEIDATRNT